MSLPLRIVGAVGPFVALLAVGNACNDDRSGFDPNPRSFVPDAGADQPECPFECSLDGRSVVRSCTGEIVETCPTHLSCGAALCQEPCAAAAADRNSNGCNFYFQLPHYATNELAQSCYAMFIVNASTQPAEVILEFKGKGLDLSKSMFRTNPGESKLIPHQGPIPPSDSAILFVSDRDPAIAHPPFEGRKGCPPNVIPALLEDVAGGTVIDAAFHLRTNVPIGATAMYPFGGAASFVPSTTLLLPVPTWAKQHILVSGWESDLNVSGVQLFASEDDTEITILPTRGIQSGPGIKGTPAKVPVTYRLNEGQYLQLAQGEELTGSVVESNKPIATFGGSWTNIPSQGYSADLIQQQIPPFEQWGSEYVGVGYRPRGGNEHEPMPYRIIAARDGTRLDYDPDVPVGAPTTMSAGEVVTFRAGTGDAFVVRSQDPEHPIYLAAYMTSSTISYNNMDYGGAGDPEFVNVVPAGQYLNSYSFYADPTYGDTSLVVVRRKTHGGFKDLWLECAGGNLTDFKPVGTRGQYEFTRVDLAKGGGPGQRFGDHVCQNGLHRAKSEGPFTATIWGWDLAASYAYPGGMAQRKLVMTPLPPIR